MSLTLNGDVASAIRNHARETYPNECCGVLIGRAGEVMEAFPLPNSTEEGPRRRFLVRPSDYQKAEARASAVAGDLLGFYHSHPDHPAEPSQYDLDHAWPSLSYVIVSVSNGEPGAMRSWRLRDDRSQFDEERIAESAPTTSREGGASARSLEGGA